METTLKKFLSILLAVLSAFTFVLFSGCVKPADESSGSGPNESSSGTKTFYTVNFETDGGSEVDSQQVEEGACVKEPEDPTKSGSVFNGWHITAEEDGDIYDFSSPVTKDFTLYAAWADESALSAKFFMNDNTDAVFTTVYFEEGKRISKPGDPVWEGHVFDGWYSDADCTEEFKFTKKYTESQFVYAKWRTVYTFEAEYSYISDDKWGQGYSGQNSGLGLIMSENGDSTENHTASNGYYVGWIYYSGASIDFTVTSDRDVSDLTIVFRLTAEYQDCTVSGDEIYVQVNEEKHNFEFSITGVYGTEEMSKKGRNDFQNYTVGSKISLKKGVNTISLVINNEKQGVGATMNASAPLVDCMYLYTSASLTLDEHKDNIK